jgi:hypothetical protein
MRFEKKGSGALLWIGDQPVKASAAGRDCSMSALRKRLGDFEPAPMPPPRQKAAAPRPLDPGAPLLASYLEERRKHYEQPAGQGQRVDRQPDEWRQLADRHRKERADMFGGSWKGKGDALNALRSLTAARQAQEKAALRDRQKLQQAARRRDRGRFPSYEEWLARIDRDAGDKWRHRERRPATIEGATFDQPTPHDIRAVRAVLDGAKVHYHLAGSRGSPAFTDRGKTIGIHDGRNREAVLAALQLSAEKWGTFTVRGNERFQKMCVELAAEHDFNIANPELQQAIATERGRIRMTREEAAPDREHRSAEIREARTPAEVYRRHLADVFRERPGQHVHPSRVDIEIAVRMRLTGHRRGEIMRAIKGAAPLDRPGEKRDWDAYAKRATEVAFGVPGDRLAAEIIPQRERFRGLEGRGRDEPELLQQGGPFSRFGLGR